MYPQRSVMTCGLATALEPPHFNPRTRVGCDAALKVKATNQIQFQSTHPRGVRLQAAAQIPLTYSFNPRTRVGCDCATHNIPQEEQMFQSTHPRGVRLLNAQRGLADSSRFNPRTRVGCDVVHIAVGHSAGSFNPRTRVGCDALLLVVINLSARFQSTHPRGVRRWSP